MTTFKSAIAICGLSQRQAAEYLGKPIDTVKSWSSGRLPVPQSVWVMLADLHERIDDTADFASNKIALGEVDPHWWGNIIADSGADPLPEGADEAAGALALLLAIGDLESLDES